MISKTFPFVTGATESWGLATVKAFADVNAYVVLVDINMKGLQFAMTTGKFLLSNVMSRIKPGEGSDPFTIGANHCFQTVPTLLPSVEELCS